MSQNGEEIVFTQEIAFYIAAAGFIAAGIMEIIFKRCYFLGRKKYTEESLKEFAVYDGITEILFGLAAGSLGFGDIGRKFCLFFVIGAMMLFAYKSKEILKKK